MQKPKQNFLHCDLVGVIVGVAFACLVFSESVFSLFSLTLFYHHIFYSVFNSLILLTITRSIAIHRDHLFALTVFIVDGG